MIDALLADSELGWTWKVNPASDGEVKTVERSQSRLLTWRSARTVAKPQISASLLRPSEPGGKGGRYTVTGCISCLPFPPGTSLTDAYSTAIRLLYGGLNRKVD